MDSLEFLLKVAQNYTNYWQILNAYTQKDVKVILWYVCLKERPLGKRF
jgi:hypothetical protein